ncbi:MAG: hypothetical protein ACI9XP_001990, partial [Lentimonas sp.]
SQFERWRFGLQIHRTQERQHNCVVKVNQLWLPRYESYTNVNILFSNYKLRVKVAWGYKTAKTFSTSAGTSILGVSISVCTTLIVKP